jgi:HK97 family phage major capsid protein
MTDATEISMGTNGGALSSYAKILDGVQAVEDANASVNALVMAPRTARTINGFLDTTTQPLRRPDNLVNIPFHSTTAVPVNMTRGSGSALSSIYMGDFSRLWFGIRTELRVEVLREAFAGNLQYGFLAYLRADVQASHESAFAVVRGITA